MKPILQSQGNENINAIISNSFFYRPSWKVAIDLIGCKLVKKKKNGELLTGIIVETEAYCQSEAACHGSKRRSYYNETLFGEPGQLYIYLTYGIYHCVNIVTDKRDWASGVLLRALAMPDEHERIASGPGLLAKRFDLTKDQDKQLISKENGLWFEKRSKSIKMLKIINTTRIGISAAKSLPWRWYLQSSRSISKRAKGDRSPPINQAWIPSKNNEE